MRAVLHKRVEDVSPLDVLIRAQAVETIRGQAEFVELARLFKRVNNIVHGELGPLGGAGVRNQGRDLLKEPAEIALREALDRVGPKMTAFSSSGKYLEALRVASDLAPQVDRFFTDVLVMVEDGNLRQARLALLGELRDLVWDIANIPEVVQEQVT